jgi:hypothetical protein
MALKIPLTAAALLMISSSALGDDKGPGQCQPGDKNCHPPREVCFNVFCTYEREGEQPQVHDEHDSYDRCHAGSTFKKWVTDDGEEIEDNSADHDGHDDKDRDVIKFEVECDGQHLYNNSAHRYTDWQGTRLQALEGPYPAVVLPRGALKDTHQYAISALELWDQTLHGYCYVYTGPQLR